MSPVRMVRTVNVVNLCFFGTLLLVSLTALPWYAIRVGISRAEWGLFLAFVLLTGAVSPSGITACSPTARSRPTPS